MTIPKRKTKAEQRKEARQVILGFCGMGLAIMFVGTAMVVGELNKTEPVPSTSVPQTQAPKMDETLARVACWNSVKSTLSNPSSAKFDLFKPVLDGDIWVSRGGVTFDNAYGGTEEREFICATRDSTGVTQSALQS
jgi:hypothetical protein